MKRNNDVTASLRNGNQAPYANHYYNVALVLNENGFIYTTEEKKPEVILNVYDNNGNEIKNINGLDYINTEEISGFDITGKTGTYRVTSHKEIRTSSSTSHKWSMKVTFVNLNNDQDKNGKCKINGYLEMSSAGE